MMMKEKLSTSELPNKQIECERGRARINKIIEIK
jgi:hypothetical protein